MSLSQSLHTGSSDSVIGQLSPVPFPKTRHQKKHHQLSRTGKLRKYFTTMELLWVALLCAPFKIAYFWIGHTQHGNVNNNQQGPLHGVLNLVNGFRFNSNQDGERSGFTMGGSTSSSSSESLSEIENGIFGEEEVTDTDSNERHQTLQLTNGVDSNTSFLQLGSSPGKKGSSSGGFLHTVTAEDVNPQSGPTSFLEMNANSGSTQTPPPRRNKSSLWNVLTSGLVGMLAFGGNPSGVAQAFNNPVPQNNNNFYPFKPKPNSRGFGPAENFARGFDASHNRQRRVMDKQSAYWMKNRRKNKTPLARKHLKGTPLILILLFSRFKFVYYNIFSHRILY